MMTNQNKQCETCAWPLECSADMKAQKPEGADCPREAAVWESRLELARITLPDDAALDEMTEVVPRNRALMLV